MSAPSAALLERYEILDTKSGGQSIVYKARDRDLGWIVAIKTPNAATRSDPRRLARFVEAMRTLARIQDENVLRVHHFYDDGELGEGVHLVTEWMDRTLAEVRASQRIDPDTALSILEKIARGLRAIHAAGVAHRDLKPANVFVSADGAQVRVGDLGGREGTIGDSPTYTAPELYDEGAPADARADLYSLGMIALELLLGPERFRAAFPEIFGGDPAVLRARWINWHRDPQRLAPALSERAPEVPEAVADLVAQLLRKDPAERPVDADEVIRRLAARGAGGRAGVPPVPVLPLPGRGARRRGPLGLSWPLWAGAGVALVAVAAAAVMLRGPSLRDEALAAGRAMMAARAEAIEAGADRRPDIEAFPRAEGDRKSGAAAYDAEKWRVAIDRFVLARTLYEESARLARLAPPEPPPEEVAAAEPPAPPETPAPDPGRALTFRAGSPPDEVDRALALCARFHEGGCERDVFASETPHEALLEPFELDAHEVTNADFEAFVAETGYRTDAERRGYAYQFGGFGSVRAWGHSWRAPLGAGSEDPSAELPVVNVSANDAEAYCAWAGGRLPTADEWEFAARGSERRLFPWGDEWRDRHAAWTPEGPSAPWPAGSFPDGATPAGHQDLAGNVWEWTATTRDGRRVLKGGSFREPNPAHLRAAFERIDEADVAHADDGFRCARSTDTWPDGLGSGPSGALAEAPTD